MSNYFGEDREIQNIGGYGYGGGFGGGAIMMVLVVVIVLWLLFRDGHRDGVDGIGHFGGFPGMWGSCGPCVQPTFKDESNFEEERNINSKLCKIEMEQQACCCKEIEATHCEGEKTRALIEQNYIQDLRDKLAAAEMEKLTLKNEMFTEKKFDQLERMNERRFDQITGAIGKLDCELPKRPPVWCEGITPNTHHTDCDREFHGRRRGCCDGGFGDGFGGF